MEQTVEEQLAQNAEAIRKVETSGQRYTNGQRELWRPDLAALDKRQQRLEVKASRVKNGGVRIQRVIPL